MAATNLKTAKSDEYRRCTNPLFNGNVLDLATENNGRCKLAAAVRDQTDERHEMQEIQDFLEHPEKLKFH